MSETETTPPANPAGANNAAPRPETFSREYVQELRAENAQWRTKSNESIAAEKAAKEAADKAHADAATAAEKARVEADERAASAEKRANERVIMAEMRTAAIKAGMVDLDALKILDLSKVKLNDAGDVEGAEELIEAAKAAKPYLFGSGKTNTSNPTSPPAPKKVEPKSVKDMTDEEYQVALKSHAWRNK